MRQMNSPTTGVPVTPHEQINILRDELLQLQTSNRASYQKLSDARRRRREIKRLVGYPGQDPKRTTTLHQQLLDCDDENKHKSRTLRLQLRRCIDIDIEIRALQRSIAGLPDVCISETQSPGGSDFTCFTLSLRPRV